MRPNLTLSLQRTARPSISRRLQCPTDLFRRGWDGIAQQATAAARRPAEVRGRVLVVGSPDPPLPSRHDAGPPRLSQIREYPTTGHAAAARGGLLDAARTPTVQAAGLMITVWPRCSSWAAAEYAGPGIVRPADSRGSRNRAHGRRGTCSVRAFDPLAVLIRLALHTGEVVQDLEHLVRHNARADRGRAHPVK
jgi:hypothetical protein